ncbi:MAG: lamin tail domain-containing protein [Deltaproteobacteria bacterium]|nr:lamin tail domain-containing protein [Deltaproteobacteria bacterium]
MRGVAPSLYMVLALGLALAPAACGDDGQGAGADAAADTDATVALDTSETDVPAETDTTDGDDVEADGEDAPTEITPDVPVEIDDDAPDGTATGPSDVTTPAEVEVVTTIVRPPEVGELFLVELMIDPIGRSDLAGEWVELLNATDDVTLDVADCWLADGDGHRFTLGDGVGIPRVAPGERYLMARSGDREDNGGLAPDLVYGDVLLDNAAGSATIGCGEVTHDALAWDAAWPLAPGRALVLAAGPHAPASSCAATALYDEANRGTPGTDGAPCPAPDVTVDACGLLSPGAGSVRVGTPLVALAWLEEAGATDLSSAIDAIPRFRAEIGLGAGAAAEDIVWSVAEPRPEAQDAAHPGRDHHGLALPALAVGTWTVAARFSLDRGETWSTCGAREVVVAPSPCDPSPCVRDEARRCEGDTLIVDPALGACEVVDDAPVCAWTEARVPCDALAGRCDDAGAAACVDVAGPPAPGEIVITEIMKSPGVVGDDVGEWIELLNVAAEPRQLSGCEVVDDGVDRLVLVDSSGALTIWPGQHLVIAASDDPSLNGGVDAAWGWAGHGDLELVAANDAVVLRCDGHDVDAVRYTQGSFPILTGSSMQLSPRRTSAVDNDAGAAWCSGRNAIQPGTTFPDYGSPGAPNVPCAEPVERCRLVAPALLEVVAGEPLEVLVQLRHPRLTDLSAGADDDGWVLVDAGLGNPGWSPTWSGWTWAPGSPDPLWSDALAPLEDQWHVTLIAPEGASERDLAGRVSIDDGRSWTYCDRDSGAEGSDGSQDGYQTQNATRLTIVAADPCNPSPCTEVPGDACDEDGRLLAAPDAGVCTRVGDEAACDYPIDLVDCVALGGTCDAEAGACLGAVGHPIAGAIVVSEIMPWPAAVADFFGEWIELESVAAGDVNLAGCTLSDGSASVLIDVPGHALVVAPGERVVLGRDASLARNGGVVVDFAWGDAFGLAQDGDVITLACDDVVIDAVAFDATFGFAVGVATQLDPARLDADDNDAASAWCAASSPYGAGDLGTPGAANAACTP